MVCFQLNQLDLDTDFRVLQFALMALPFSYENDVTVSDSTYLKIWWVLVSEKFPYVFFEGKFYYYLSFIFVGSELLTYKWVPICSWDCCYMYGIKDEFDICRHQLMLECVIINYFVWYILFILFILMLIYSNSVCASMNI